MKWMTFRPNYFSFYPPIRDVTAETPKRRAVMFATNTPAPLALHDSTEIECQPSLIQFTEADDSAKCPNNPTNGSIEPSINHHCVSF
jgi:hypothetical protein